MIPDQYNKQSSPSIYRHGCHTPVRGSITCILGPMFSGKTTELLRMHDRQMIARKKCVLVKYAGDTRYDTERISTHTKLIGQGVTVKARRLAEVEMTLFDESVQVVSIDEGQFFEDLASTCEQLAARGKIVCVALLSGTFERKPFPQTSLLLPFADEIKQVSAVCVRCGSDAHFTHRNTMETKIEVIGGEDTYQALCRECYCEANDEKNAYAYEKEMEENRSDGVRKSLEKVATGVEQHTKMPQVARVNEAIPSPPRKLLKDSGN